MSKSSLSIIYLVGSFILIFCILAYGASQVIAYFNSGADRDQLLLRSHHQMSDFYQPEIQWLPLRNEGRKMEAGTLTKISKDYLASYFHLQEAQRTGKMDGLLDYYTEKARTHVVSLVEDQLAYAQVSRGTTISHLTRLDFYAEDGTIATLTDRVISYKQIQANGRTFNLYDTSEYRVMLLLEDNFWRIRHSVRGSYLNEPQKDVIRIPTESVFLSLGAERKIKGINYYPQKNPWTSMWKNFEEPTLQKDFQLIGELGFNTIRIFVPFQEFGKANVDPEQLAKLERMMDLANQANLKVIVTLFDFFLGYRIEEWTLSDRHAESIISHLSKHPALLAWDVKNEPDLDFENSGQTDVLEWLNFIIQRMRVYDAATPITIGWSQPEQMIHLQDQLDFLSFHYYRTPEELDYVLSTLITDKPIFLGETGCHSFDSWWYPFRRTNEEQANYYQQISKVITSRDLHYAFWTLYDFQSIPSNVAGKWPWQKGPQKSYGIIDEKGRTKPSYQWIKNFNINTK